MALNESLLLTRAALAIKHPDIRAILKTVCPKPPDSRVCFRVTSLSFFLFQGYFPFFFLNQLLDVPYMMISLDPTPKRR